MIDSSIGCSIDSLLDVLISSVKRVLYRVVLEARGCVGMLRDAGASSACASCEL